MDLNKTFTRFAAATAHAAGTPAAFCLCVVVVLVWAVTGPLFKFSDTWQLVINTGTTIITFLMVFLIQNTQNRDGMAIQIKLDELILTSGAENDFIGIEALTDKQLEALHLRCAEAAARSQSLAERAGEELDARKSRKKPTPPRKGPAQRVSAKKTPAKRPAAKKTTA